MRTILQHKVKIMGVINITPNSFSDGNQINTIDLLSRRIQLLQESCDAIDIGAESTAPKNSVVSSEVEWARWEKLFLPLLKKDFFKPDMVLSIDTYRTEIFYKLLKHLREAGIENEIWWNDISGDFDEAAQAAVVLKNVKYVYCLNFAASRTVGSQHLNFKVSDEEFMAKCLEDLLRVYTIVQKKNISDKVIFDPCFGFAKSREQNLKLIDEWESVSTKLNPTWLIGLSKKSFLRPTPETPDDILEHIHSLALAKILKNSPAGEYIFRVHRPEVLKQVEIHLAKS
ncbi:MAG: dihydropteroate synthase [Bacteriovoracaceae bacterium]|nr:dihydropteroate synthase [Bacteriovoracaceae bacterium]